MFVICAFPLSWPINSINKSTYKEHSWKGAQRNQDLSRKKRETRGFGKPPVFSFSQLPSSTKTLYTQGRNLPEWILVKKLPWKPWIFWWIFRWIFSACFPKENGPKKSTKKSTSETKHQNPPNISGKGCPWYIRKAYFVNCLLSGYYFPLHKIIAERNQCCRCLCFPLYKGFNYQVLSANARGGGNSPRKLSLQSLDFWPPNWGFSIETL